MIKPKELSELLNICRSYASEISRGIKGVSKENMEKIKEKYPNVKFKEFTKPRYKIINEKGDED